MERILLDLDQTKVKCHMGEGHRCCRYLTVGADGFECASQNEFLKNALDKRVASRTINARSGPCENPSDRTSEAKEWSDSNQVMPTPYN